MPRTLTTRTARKMAAARKTYGGPRGVRMPCGWCGKPMTASQMRKHFTDCPRRPND